MRRRKWRGGRTGGEGGGAPRGGGGVGGAAAGGQTGGEARGAAGGQRVVGAGDVVAERRAGLRADEQAARAPHPRRERLGGGARQLQVLGRERLGEGERRVQRVGVHLDGH